jgi:hypothetical protein
LLEGRDSLWSAPYRCREKAGKVAPRKVGITLRDLTVAERVLRAKHIAHNTAADPNRRVRVVGRGVARPRAKRQRVGILIVEVYEAGISVETSGNEADRILEEGVRVTRLVEELGYLVQERNEVDVKLLLARRSATM